MFHPPQAAIGLALLPVAWAAAERARAERGGPAPRERDPDLARYFPPGWQRETLPDWPARVSSSASRATARWHGSRLGIRLGLSLRSAVRRLKGWAPGFPRG